MEGKAEKYVVSWDEFQNIVESAIELIASHQLPFDSVFGIPRGGVAFAIAVAAHFKKPIVREPGPNTLILDDIVDSGATFSKFPRNYRIALFRKSTTPELPLNCFALRESDAWVEFPWETNVGEMPAEDAVTRMIQAIGDDPTREGLLETPKRVVKSWKELFAGYKIDTAKLLSVTFEDGLQDCDELVLCKDIEFYSTCEHHMLPIIGKMHIGYIPDKKVVGLSKLARLGDAYARRLQIQEKMTKQIADDLIKHLKPKGVGVIVTAKHFCMCARGVGKQSSWMTTSSMQGVLRENATARQEFLKLCEPSS